MSIIRRKPVPDNIYSLPQGRHPKHNATSFKPGTPGNPGGFARPPKEFAALMRDYSIDAAKEIKYWAMCRDPKVSPQMCMYIINRAYGMPVQANEISGPGGSPLEAPEFVVNLVSMLPPKPIIDGTVEK